MIKIIEKYRQLTIKIQIILFFGLIVISCETDLNKNLIEDKIGDSVEELSVKDQDEFKSLYGFGYENIQSGNFTEALKLLLKAYDIKDNDSDLNYALGYSYSAIGEDSVAILWFTKVVELNPAHSGAFFSRGVSNHLRQQDSLAILDYNQSILLNPSFRDVYYNRAISYLAVGRNEEACADLNYAYSLGDMNSLQIIQQFCMNNNHINQ